MTDFMKNVWKSGTKVWIAWQGSETLVQFIFLLKDEQGVYLQSTRNSRVVFVPWTALAEVQWPEPEGEQG